MKLPPDYQVTSLDDLRTQVNDRINIATEGNGLEMSKEQYLRYKELVWRRIQQEDPIRRFDGMEIVLSTPEATKTGGGSV